MLVLGPEITGRDVRTHSQGGSLTSVSPLWIDPTGLLRLVS